MSKGLTTPWLNSTIGSFIRLKFGYDLVWLIYLPMVLGLIWFVWYWFSHHRSWNWGEAMPNLLIASIATTPWAWLYDSIFVIPAILYIASLLSQRWEKLQSKRRIGIMMFFLFYQLICAVITIDRGKIFPYPHNLWWFSSFLWICAVAFIKLSKASERHPSEILL